MEKTEKKMSFPWPAQQIFPHSGNPKVLLFNMTDLQSESHYLLNISNATIFVMVSKYYQMLKMAVLIKVSVIILFCFFFSFTELCRWSENSAEPQCPAKSYDKSHWGKLHSDGSVPEPGERHRPQGQGQTHSGRHCPTQREHHAEGTAHCLHQVLSLCLSLFCDHNS